MEIIFFTRYGSLGASSRLRFFQYIPYLSMNNINVTVNYLLDDIYLDRFYRNKRISLISICSRYFKRMSTLLRCKKYDLLFIEKELFPWFPPWAERLLTYFKIPYIVDYDDAIFHNYDMHRSSIIRYILGDKIKTVMKSAVLVTAGNDYIAKYAYWASANRVEIVPTVIDLSKYYIAPKPKSNVFTIGWIGSPSTSKFLQVIKPALVKFCTEVKTVIVLVGSGPMDLGDLPLELRSWSEETEVIDINSFDVGVMPLFDGQWEKGKCGYKLIQYMSCALPVIASPVGINNDIIENGINGYLADTTEEWVAALKVLYNNPRLRKKLGDAGRKKVESCYSIQAVSPLLVRFLNESLEGIAY